MSYHHEFGHAIIRGAGYAAGRGLFHAVGWVGMAVLFAVLLLIEAAKGRRR